MWLGLVKTDMSSVVGLSVRLEIYMAHCGCMGSSSLWQPQSMPH